MLSVMSSSSTLLCSHLLVRKVTYKAKSMQKSYFQFWCSTFQCVDSIICGRRGHLDMHVQKGLNSFGGEGVCFSDHASEAKVGSAIQWLQKSEEL